MSIGVEINSTITLDSRKTKSDATLNFQTIAQCKTIYFFRRKMAFEQCGNPIKQEAETKKTMIFSDVFVQIDVHFEHPERYIKIDTNFHNQN